MEPSAASGREAELAERQGEVASPGGYVPGLDGLRALAVISVWLLHIDRPHFPGGAVGVDEFFALSAYLITGIILQERIAGRVSFSSFYWRRAFRLFPALVMCVIFVAVPSMLANHDSSQLPWAGTALIYINDFLQAWTAKVPGALDQTWSLAVEEQFYLVWPAILLFVLPRIPRRWSWIPFAILAVAAVALLGSGTGNYFLPTGHLLALTLGAWAAVAKAQWRVLPRPPVAAGWIATGFLVALVFVSENSTLRITLIGTAGPVAATVLILYLDSGRPSLLKQLFGHHVLTWLGARSYGIYLYGLSLIGLVGATGLKLHFAVFVDAALTLAIISLSYKFVEAPVRYRGRQWLNSRAVGGV